jgi:hypothetical protein
MKRELEMNIRSRRSLTESVAKKQITALSDFADGLMRPDKCGEFEPIRAPFDPAYISTPIQWLAKPHGTFFYRKGRPTHVSGQMWNLTHSPTARFPSPLFTNYWTGQFDGYWAKRVGIEKIEGFVLEMFRVTGSDFGFLTSAIDRNAKNQPAPNCSYKGLDPATGVPGLYWINFFSDEYATWLGLRELPKEVATLKELAGAGVALKFCESPDECRTLEVLQRQRAAIEWLGQEKFFDIRFPDRKAVVPDWSHLPLHHAR